MTRRSWLSVYAPVLVALQLFGTLSCRPTNTGSEHIQHPKPTLGRSSAEGRPSYDFASVDTILRSIVASHGPCALVLTKRDQVIYRKSFGDTTTEEVIPIASASKWLSGAVIMSLVDEGRLSLDDKVAKYLPSFGGPKSTITIRQLFAHTSGLPPEVGCRNNKSTSLEKCVNQIATVQLRSEPGEEFYYGGVSMHVAGRIAEIVTGRSWNDLFVERVAAPLGMSKTDFFAYGQTDNPRPAGDARSSVDDYSRFLQMILLRGSLNGRQILTDTSVVEMHGDQTAGARIAYTIYGRHSGLNENLPLARYGVGMWRERVDETTQKLLEASSQGALGFSPWIDVERNLGGVLSIKGTFSQSLPEYLRLKEEIRRIVGVDAQPLPLD